MPGGAAATTASATDGGNENTGNESTTNYEISKTSPRPGAAARHGQAPVGGRGRRWRQAPGKDGKPGAYTPRSAEEMQHLNDLVKAAMGFSADRGDSLQVVNVKFPDAEDGEGVAGSSPLMGFDKNDIMRAVELAILGLVAVLILFLVIRPLIRGADTAGAAAA